MSEKTARQKQIEYINSLPELSLDGIEETSSKNRTENVPEATLRHNGVEQSKILKQTAMNFSRAEANKNYEFKHVDVQQVLKMKTIPPLRKEFFTDSAVLESEMKKTYKDILSVFNPQYREMITISGTTMKFGDKTLQVLLVIAPVEAEDVARIKLNGLKIMNRTVFPTAKDTWMVKTSAFPKVVDIRVNILPALCYNNHVMELLQIPDIAELGEIQREQQRTELGTF